MPNVIMMIRKYNNRESKSKKKYVFMLWLPYIQADV